MSKFVIVEEPSGAESVFYNFAIIEASDKDEARDKYTQNTDVDSPESSLIVVNVEEIENDYYHYLEIDFENLK